METLLIFSQRNILYLILPITFLVTSLTANSQAIKNKPNVKIKIDTVAHASLGALNPARQALGVAYKNSVTTNDISRNKIPIPMFPYIEINFNKEFLPPAPFRVYMAKLSSGNKNDYVLVVGRCKEVISSPVIKNTANKKYTDNINKTKPVSLASSDWFVVNESALNSTRDKVTYTAIDWNLANTYVNNFKKAMKVHGLDTRYYTCFVVKTAVGKGLFQPVIINPRLQGSPITYELTYIPRILASGEVTSTCCATPPETGNSIDSNN